MKGKLLIAQSRKDKKEEGQKAFFYPKDLKAVLKAQEVCCKRLLK